MTAACQAIEKRCGRIVRRSEDYYSEPWGYESDKEYLNIAVALETAMQPMALLRETQAIERELGRTTKSRTRKDEVPVYTDRPMDIDLIEAYDRDPREGKAEEIRMDTDELTIPHPRMAERPFVTVPLNEIR